jgi:PAS domain-containing protein
VSERAATGEDDVKAGARRSIRSTTELAGLARSFAIAIPPAVVASWIIVRGAPPTSAWLALGTALGVSGILAWSLRDALARRLGTVSSVLAAYREGDFSVRARARAGDAPLEDVLRELNRLGDVLREQRLGEMEGWALLRKVMAEVDVVVLAFNDDGYVRLANDAAARALGEPSSAILGREAADLGLAELLDGTALRIVKRVPSLGAGPWELRRAAGCFDSPASRTRSSSCRI